MPSKMWHKRKKALYVHKNSERTKLKKVKEIKLFLSNISNLNFRYASRADFIMLQTILLC